MEKRSPLFYIGLFVLLILAIFSFSAGTLGIAGFIRSDKSISFLAEFGISFLSAITFIVGYFVWVFAFSGSKAFALSFLTKTSRLAAAVFFTWGILLIVLSILIIVKFFSPIRTLLQALQNYSFAGMVFAWASDRFRTATKI